ncbi:NAD(P)/FAD-dependent oxidoreductase [Rhodococcus sp. D2-41]|uniref:NAD(P)-binding domain-containing protein n=1 Tax=Speluncibacter jeojiensis TaxID=2710754 RepID=UPI0024102D01|nr:NAD(P)-binding domain-containing protein [Rhodococcus sp. D2-41]MDG3011781.1 NAD(P)/FAD-dependent oxidoreductase [Rhodococcus sp. D2-41]
MKSVTESANVAEREIVVIGAGQAGLSAGYFLTRAGLAPESDLTIVDHAPGPGGAWQFRWPSLTLRTANRVHDLPGLPLRTDRDEVPAAVVVPAYFAEYERRFGLRVRRPVSVRAVRGDGELLRVETDSGTYLTRGLINATGTWERPFVPYYPGIGLFRGRQLHTRDYVRADEFAGKRVVVVGGGISAVQLLDEISRVASTTWVTRREPEFHEQPFSADDGRAAVARVEDRVRHGLPAESVVSVTGLPVTDRVRAARARGVLRRLPMFSRITEDGVVWDRQLPGGPAAGTALEADVILWATGFRSALDHLAPLQLRGPGGGITMTGRLATEVAADPRIHLLGYGPTASTIGANRAGRVAVRELLTHLGQPAPVV